MAEQLGPPVVGVTTYGELADWSNWPQNAYLTPQTYLRCIHAAGGTSVLLPGVHGGEPDSPEPVLAPLSRLDGLVVIGGNDVCGRFYGRDEEPEEHVQHRPDRDAYEIAAIRHAWENHMPILAICRGIQILNVALGGTLVKDLVTAGASREHRGPVWGELTRHSVRLDPGTRIHALYGDEAAVPSHHHQAIDRLADPLRVTARASDGVIESVEGDDDHFVMGVQWHPEEGEDMVLFESFVEACQGRRLPALASA
jgi:gamma-glutamyl-gamma-aminobutyrate hydrolase PuuD